MPRWDKPERAYWKDLATVFLGSSGYFDYWGNPISGNTYYLGDVSQGYQYGLFGERNYFRMHRNRFKAEFILSPEGESW